MTFGLGADRCTWLRHVAPRAAMALSTLLLSCTTAAASDAAFEPGGRSVDELVGTVLAAKGPASYHGACPTPESLELDPLSTDAQDALASLTGTGYCSWPLAVGADVRTHPDSTIAQPHAAETHASENLTLNVERLDVLGDEATYYLALTHDHGGWRLATLAERAALDTITSNSAAVYLDDLRQPLPA